MHYSESTRGFYDPAIHGDDIPSDAVEISSKTNKELLVAQSAGMVIVADENGYPIAIDPPAPVRTMKSMLADIAAKRWTVETGGITVAGALIKTDRESQSQIISVYTSLKSALIADTPWKAADGYFTPTTLAELEPVAQAVAEHVRACFAAEQSHYDAINLLQTQAELESYDINSGWPPSCQ